MTKRKQDTKKTVSAGTGRIVTLIIDETQIKNIIQKFNTNLSRSIKKFSHQHDPFIQTKQ